MSRLWLGMIGEGEVRGFCWRIMEKVEAYLWLPHVPGLGIWTLGSLMGGYGQICFEERVRVNVYRD